MHWIEWFKSVHAGVPYIAESIEVEEIVEDEEALQPRFPFRSAAHPLLHGTYSHIHPLSSLSPPLNVCEHEHAETTQIQTQSCLT